MSGGTAGRLRELLEEGRRDEAHGLLARTRDGSEPPPDPAELGAERIGTAPASADEHDPWLAAWSLPAELGGGALFEGGIPMTRRPRTTLVDPEDTVVVSFGGIGAAVGSVPLDVYRRTADGEVSVLAARTVEVGPGSYGEPFEGDPTPEELLEDTEELLDAVREATGCRWLRSGDLEQEAWDRGVFLERYNALAEEAGVEPLDGATVDRENFYMRYAHSIAYDSLEAFARDAFRAREAPRAADDALEAAARRLEEAIREETGIGADDLAVATDGPRFVARLDGEELSAWPCPRSDWEATREELDAEVRAGAGDAEPEAVAERLVEAQAERIAEALHVRAGDDLDERLVEAERERLSDRIADPVETAARGALSGLLPEGAEVSAEVVELPRGSRHGDPGDARERGLPDFGVEVRTWDPDAAALVEIEEVPPDPERLAREAVDRLRRALGDEGDGDDG